MKKILAALLLLSTPAMSAQADPKGPPVYAQAGHWVVDKTTGDFNCVAMLPTGKLPEPFLVGTFDDKMGFSLGIFSPGVNKGSKRGDPSNPAIITNENGDSYRAESWVWSDDFLFFRDDGQTLMRLLAGSKYLTLKQEGATGIIRADVSLADVAILALKHCTEEKLQEAAQ